MLGKLKNLKGEEVDTEDVTKIALINLAERKTEETTWLDVLPMALEKKLAVEAAGYLVPTLLGYWFSTLVTEN